VKIRKEKVNNPAKIHDNADVTVTFAGNVVTVRHSQFECKQNIQKLDKDHYIKLSEDTGEVYKFNHAETRGDNLINVRSTLSRLRNLINANVTIPENCLWITLTYKENMTDNKRLYKDFHNFILRLHTYCKNNNVSHFEYIACAEPQQRGAWHLHVIFIFQNPAFIPKSDLLKVWGHGFVHIKKVDCADNIGQYLTAYLCDMELSDVADKRHIKAENLKLIDGKKPKTIVKGERMKLYPVGFRIYRKSSGIVQPTITTMSYSQARELLNCHTLVSENAVKLIDENDIEINNFKYEQYVKNVNYAFRNNLKDGDTNV